MITEKDAWLELEISAKCYPDSDYYLCKAIDFSGVSLEIAKEMKAKILKQCQLVSGRESMWYRRNGIVDIDYTNFYRSRFCARMAHECTL